MKILAFVDQDPLETVRRASAAVDNAWDGQKENF